MADDYEDRVHRHAYRIWQEEGCPEGRADIHWDMARELVAIEGNQKLATKPLGSLGSNDQLPEPVESPETVENLGEFPTLTDQGEGQAYPERHDEETSSAS